MTFYQELQLDQVGSKSYIASITDPKEKRKHIAIYLFKILLTVSFCVAFVTIYTKLFGANNSIVGVVVLLSVMVFRYAMIWVFTTRMAAFSILIIFCILAVGPRLTNMVSPGIAFFVNIICIFALMLLGCHNVIMSNHSTFVLAYLLLQGYDVSGHDYTLRLIGLLVGAASTALILYRNHKKMSYNEVSGICFRSLICLLLAQDGRFV